MITIVQQAKFDASGAVVLRGREMARVDTEGNLTIYCDKGSVVVHCDGTAGAQQAIIDINGYRFFSRVPMTDRVADEINRAVEIEAQHHHYSIFREIVCRLIGCGSIFARWFEWPHRLVCSRLFR